ncbi:unnamed protein product, partial [Staurois parvus]
MCFTISTLRWMAVLCTGIQSTVPELTGRRTVSKQFSAPSKSVGN